MQKFPLRMKDNDLLVTELYKDPHTDHITAISVYLTPKTTSKYMFDVCMSFHELEREKKLEIKTPVFNNKIDQ